MGIFSYDFAAVDIREELCYHSRPEKAKFKRNVEQKRKPMKESITRRKKRQPIPERVSGDGSAPPRFLVAVNFAFRRLAKATRPLCSVTSPLPKKSLRRKSFSGTLLI